jgi:hypothetical protein
MPEKAVEVRDKLVSESDVHIFVRKCASMGVRDAAVVMASPSQKPLDGDALASWASDFGVGLTLFYGWRTLVEQSLFWASAPKPDAARVAVERIVARLIGVEASPEAVALWQRLVRGE